MLTSKNASCCKLKKSIQTVWVISVASSKHISTIKSPLYHLGMLMHCEEIGVFKLINVFRLTTSGAILGCMLSIFLLFSGCCTACTLHAWST